MATTVERSVVLDGLRVTAQKPVMVAQGVGHCWFPQLTRFPTGELLASVSIVPDAHALAVAAQGIYISTDAGRSWEHRYSVAVAGISIKCPRPNGDVLIIPHPARPDPPGQWRSFSAPYVRYQNGGRRVVVEDRGMRAVGLPRDVRPQRPEHVLPGAVNCGEQCFDGDCLEVDGRLIATNYLRFQGDDLYSVVVFASEDEGRTWEYLSTVAGPEAAPDALEGPDESSMTVLETGEVMIVMRVGSGPGQYLARSYSGDGGRSWSPVDRLPAFSVEPCLRRLSNGTLAISSGRPGIYLWLSTDARGRSWQSIDIVEIHNTLVGDPRCIITPERSGDRERRHAHDQTTAYTEMVEIAPNQLLVIYDRTPFGWNPVPRDSGELSRVFVMAITVERS